MKRLIAILCCVQLLCGLTACDGGAAWEKDPRPLVVCTVFPAYDFVREVAGDLVNAVLLLDSSADVHNFSPSAKDIAAIRCADLFIYVGGVSDAWAKDAIPEGALSVAMTDVVSGGHEGHDHAEDEHVWLSLKNAQKLVECIANLLCRVLPDSTTDLRAKANAYTAKLQALDASYGQVVSSAKRHTVVFADRYPFRYLMEDYGLTCYAAFDGCSTETQASFATVTALAEKVSALQLPAVLVLEDSDGALAHTVCREAGRPDLPVLTMHSLQSVSKAQIDQGTTYLSLMSKNLSVLQEALN